MDINLPKRVLLLFLLLSLVFSVFFAVHITPLALALIPLAIVVIVAFFVKPELGIGLFIGGQNFFGILLFLAGVDRPIIVYPLMGLSISITVVYLLIQGKGGIPRKFNAVMFAVLFFTIVLFANFHRTIFPHHTMIKGFTFVVACLIPFVALNFLPGETKFLKSSFIAALFFAAIPVAYGVVGLVQSGIGGASQRFDALELVNINQYARNIGFASIILVWYFFKAKSLKLRIGLFCFLGLSLLVMVATGSRTSFIATAGAILFYLIAFSEMNFTGKAVSVILAGSIAAIPVILGFGSMTSRFSNLQYMDLSVAGRIGMWLAAWQHKFDNVLFGVGTGNFASILPAWAVGVRLQFPHNLFIEFYMEWGIFGIISYILLFTTPVFLWLKIRRSKDYDLETKKLSNLILTFVAFTFVLGMADLSAPFPYMYFALGIMSAIYSRKLT